MRHCAAMTVTLTSDERANKGHPRVVAGVGVGAGQLPQRLHGRVRVVRRENDAVPQRDQRARPPTLRKLRRIQKPSQRRRL